MVKGKFGSIILKLLIFLKFINQDIISLIIIGFLYSIFVVLGLIASVISEFRCQSIFSTLYTGMVITFLVLIICNIGIFFFDGILIIIGILRGKIKRSLINSDPFYFRLQQIFGILGFLVLIISFVFIIFGRNIAPTILSFVDKDKVDIYSTSLAITGTHFLLMFYFAGFVLIFSIFRTILKKIKDNCMKKTSEVDNSIFEECLNNEEMKKFFLEFTISEWSSENYFIYFDIINFQKMKDIQMKRELAQKIYSTYLNGNSSELEVNITQELCREIKQKIDNEEEEIDIDLFKEVLKSIRSNLKDTFGRFRFTQDYLNFQKTSDILNKEVAE